MRKQFIDESLGGSSRQVKKEEVEAYRQQVERFQELLLILMHICRGQPRGAPKILGIRLKNTEQGGI